MKVIYNFLKSIPWENFEEKGEKKKKKKEKEKSCPIRILKFSFYNRSLMDRRMIFLPALVAHPRIGTFVPSNPSARCAYYFKFSAYILLTDLLIFLQ